MKKKQKWILGIGITLFIILLIVAVVMYVMYGWSPFDADSWKDAFGSGSSPSATNPTPSPVISVNGTIYQAAVKAGEGRG